MSIVTLLILRFSANQQVIRYSVRSTHARYCIGTIEVSSIVSPMIFEVKSVPKSSATRIIKNPLVSLPRVASVSSRMKRYASKEERRYISTKYVEAIMRNVLSATFFSIGI